MKQIKRKLLSLLLAGTMLFTLAPAPLALAADNTIYVASTGDDANDGSQGAPYATLDAAYAAAQDHGTITIMDDLALEHSVTFAEDKTINLSSAGNATVTYTGEENINNEGGGLLAILDGSVLLSDLTVQMPLEMAVNKDRGGVLCCIQKCAGAEKAAAQGGQAMRIFTEAVYCLRRLRWQIKDGATLFCTLFHMKVRKLRRSLADWISPSLYWQEEWIKTTFRLSDVEEAAAVAEKQLEAERDKCKGLSAKLLQTERQLSDMSDKIISYLTLPESQLREIGTLPVYRNMKDGEWEVPTTICSLGGCDMGICEFETEREAHLFTAALAAVGYEMPHSTPCSECYAEYLKECI